MGREDIEHLVTPILDESLSIEERAIALFMFQVAILYPGPNPKTKKDRETRITKRERAIGRARTFSASRILEAKWQSLSEKKSQPLSIRDAVNDDSFCRIFDKNIGAFRGFQDIRNVAGGNRFQYRLRRQKQLAERLAPVIDFCLVYLDAARKRSRSLSIENVRELLVDPQIFPDAKIRRTKLNKTWREFGQSAVFIYLIENPQIGLTYPDCSKKNFAEKLTSIVANIDHLKTFFGAYEAICEQLAIHGYIFPRTGVAASPSAVPRPSPAKTIIAELL